MSVMLARRAIERADVVVLVIDAHAPAPPIRTRAIAGDAHEAGRGIIIAANKWDLMKEQGPDAYKAFDENVRYQLKFLDYAPILHISAKSGERTPKLLEAIDKVAAARRVRVPTPELNRFIEQVTIAARAGQPGTSQRARACMRRRPASRRRRSCSSPTSRRSCIFRTSVISKIVCARRTGSSARRSRSPSASDRAAPRQASRKH